MKVTKQDVDNKQKMERLKMTESDFQSINPAGHKREYRADGSYTWSNSYKPNDNGKPTKVQQAINSGMRKFIEADTARAGEMQARVHHEPMRDHLGQVHYIEAGKVDDCASRPGWGTVWHAGGLILRTGPDGMDFRLVRGEWEATGFRLTRGENVPIEPIGMQRDPDGNWWSYREGEWRRYG